MVVKIESANNLADPFVGKSGFVSHTKHTAEATKHGSISFKIDNMRYVNFRI